MAYSEWQQRRIRQRLNAYRIWRRKRHGNKGWEFVAGDILHEQDIADSAAFPQDDPVKALSESLRRFDKQLQTPDEHRLDMVCKFLELKGFLGPIDLKQDREPYHAAYALNEFFGMHELSTKFTSEYLSKHEGVFRAVSAADGNIVETTLALNLSQDDFILEATEIRAVFRDFRTLSFENWSDPERKSNHLASIESTGWATCTPRSLHLIFLRDARDSTPFSYTVLRAEDPPPDQRTSASLTLLRTQNGFAEAQPSTLYERPDADDLLEKKVRPNVLTFHKKVIEEPTLAGS